MPKMVSADVLLKKLERFPWSEWNESLGKGLFQPYRDLLVTSAERAADLVGGTFNPKDPLLSKFMTNYVSERVVQLNATTKADVKSLLRAAFEGGDTDKLSEEILGRVREQFDGYEAWRAERIARTETAITYNNANVLGFSQSGVSEVEVIDGTEDEACADANGQTWSLKEALSDPIAHPNCVRAMIPIVPDEESRREFEQLMLDDDLPYLCAIMAERVASLEDPCTDRVLDPIEGED